MAVTLRTNSAAVQALLGVNYDTVNAPSLTAFMETAALLIDRVEDCAVDGGSALTADELEMLERYVAAHFYQTMDQGFASKSTLSASMSAHGQTGMYLEGTKYGQAAISMDYTGCLAAIAQGQGARASFTWLGKRKSAQTDYVDRD